MRVKTEISHLVSLAARRIIFSSVLGGAPLVAQTPAQIRKSWFSGPGTMTTFGSEQYVGRSEGPQSHPDPNLPPVTTTFRGEPGVSLEPA
jgi:hypothetical protein